MKLTEIILQGTAPVQTRALWAKPSDDGIVELKVFNNGAWQDTYATPDLSPYMKTADFNEEIAKYLLKTDASTIYQTKTDNTLATTAKTIVGAIAELKDAVDSKASSDALNAKQNATDQSLQTYNKTVVGAINEILPKATGVGKVDPNSFNSTGEVFNCYEDFEDYYANVASGDYSHAEGSDTTASRTASHAEGLSTTAEGNYSHAEGQSTTAIGVASHAEGVSTSAGGSGSHAEGYSTTTEGMYSHAEGYKTTAPGTSSHAEGSNTTARGMYSHAEGSNTNALNPYEHAEGEFNVSNTGDTEDLQTRHSVGIGTSSSDRKNAHEIMANGDHYVYGLGGYDGTNAIEGTSKTLQEVINGKQDTLVSGTSIKTINGESLLGSGDIEITGGTGTPDLSDYQTKSDDTLNTTNKTVVGAINEIENRTLNLSTQYPSDGATLTVGTSNEPLTRIDFHSPEPAFELKGPSVLASPNSPLKYRFALGDPKTTWTEYITLQNQTDDSLQTTNKTIVGAINEIASKPSGVGKIDSTSDGTGEIFNSYTGAIANEASGSASHAEGSSTTASASGAHAEGYNTTASGNYSHAEGYTTTASGNDSHSEGNRSTASGAYSHAEGDHTEAFGSSEHSEGKYNKSYKSTSASIRVIHSVGIGSAESDRKNAHEIKINGDHYVYGVGGFDGTNSDTAQSLQEVINNKADSTLLPTYTTVPTLTADYNIPANATMVEKIYMITIGATVYDVTGDSAIKWAGGVTPTASANSILVVSVLNNLATWQTFI